MINATMLKEFVAIMKKDDYNARFYALGDTINDITIDVAEEYCKVHKEQNDGIELLNSFSDEDYFVLLGEVMKHMLEKADT